MRSQHAAEQVMRGADVGDPVAHGFVDGVFQRARSGTHAANFGAEQPHAEDVEFLAAHVFGAHVDDALEAQQRADRRRRDAVLAGAGFGDHALLAHALDQQALPEAVIDFVRAGVEQVFALEIDFCAAKFFGQAAGEEERRGASGIGLQQQVEALAGIWDRAWLFRIRARVPGARPSVFPERSVRRRRRSGRQRALRLLGRYLRLGA